MPTPDILTSEIARLRHQNAKDTWGLTVEAKLKAVCTWFKVRGMPDAPC